MDKKYTFSDEERIYSLFLPQQKNAALYLETAQGLYSIKGAEKNKLIGDEFSVVTDTQLRAGDEKENS